MTVLRNVLFAIFMVVAGVSVGVGSAGAAACPNESVRNELGVTRLPQCRAYEQVTPAYKEGYPVILRSLSSDGNKAILFSLANIDGAEGAGESAIESNLYTAVRTAGGWHLTPLNAPLSQFVGQVPVAYEAQSGATLWEQHTPSQSAFTRGLYARSTEGDYRFIGRVSIPFAGEETQEADYMYLSNANHIDEPEAATHDYEHVIARALQGEDYLPFDETLGKISFYEYSGANEPPVLVGVQGGKESHDLVSRCATILGSGQSSGEFGSLYNAISADGETVFFTAEAISACGVHAPPVAELYARLHGSPLSPLLAETVHVSASECTVACGEESGKNFEGASESGKIVYFTSTQKLTNNATDGTTSGEAYNGSGCTNTTPAQGGCDLYVYDAEAPGMECQQEHHCLRLVAGGEVLGVAGIAENGQRVYYVKRNNEGLPDLYVYDLAEDRSVLVAHLSFTGEQEATIWQREFNHPVQVTGEGGRYLLFASATPGLTEDQEGSVEQLFEYDAVTGELVRVSKGEDGYDENGNGVTIGINPESIAEPSEHLGLRTDFKSETNRLSISSDGRTVVFRTRGKLSPYATSAEKCFSVYEFHTEGPLSSGEVRLLSDGQDINQSGPRCGAFLYPTMMDATGNNILFSTADPLVPTDTDGGQRDLYDARIDGGFALPRGGLCAGERCGPTTATGGAGMPSLAPEGSATQAPETTPNASGTTPPQPAATKPKAKTPSSASRAAALRRALRACRKIRARSRRSACERAARGRYRAK